LPRSAGRARGDTGHGRARKRLLGDDTEAAPTTGGISGDQQVSSGLGEAGVGRAEGVLGVRVARLDLADESLGEREIADP
jgi:hypothetical protein